jgi:hypothetical protein
MAYNYETGTALQVIHNNISVATSYTTPAYTYTEIPGTTTTLNVLAAGSTLYLQCYVNGWGNTGNGVNIAFKINGSVAGSSNSSNGDSWCRAINGGTSGRSYNVGRSMLYKHGLQAGSQITVSLMLGTWSTGNGIYAGWSNYQTYFHVTLIELDTV